MYLSPQGVLGAISRALTRGRKGRDCAFRRHIFGV